MKNIEKLRVKCREEYYGFYSSLLEMSKSEIFLNQCEKMWFLQNLHELVETNFFNPPKDIIKKALSCENFTEKIWDEYVESDFSDFSDWSKLTTFICDVLK